VTDIAVLVPVLERPERAGPLVESLLAASRTEVELIFLVTEGDDAQLTACLATDAMTVVVPFPLEGGDYARKINHGILCTDAPWLFQAGDDLRFHDGWDETLLAFSQARPTGRVLGTNDMGNPLVKRGMHSTHSLIQRSYVEEYGTIDEPGKALHEGYWHCWVDNELIETAKSRSAYWSCRRSVVEHLHHIWRKGTDDSTYRRGQRRYHEDHALFRERRALWRDPRRRTRVR
jgi:glycosyltransferase involved in cell wall biosynthesis